MTYQEEQELLRLTRENNAMLKWLLSHHESPSEDFLMNVIANVISNKYEQINP